MPLIDVIFLLLTFFIYAMVLMVRAELLPVQMPALAAGKPATPAPAVTISIDQEGRVFVDREQTDIDSVLARIQEAVAQDPETVVYIAADERGDTDRLPTFLSLYDRLSHAGLNIKLVGRPSDEQ